METQERLHAALERLLMFHPFFAYIALQVDFTPKESIPSMETDSKSIYYNSSYVDDASMDKLIYVIAHEVSHIILLHPLRTESKDFKLWNQACDYAINLLLKESGIDIPNNVLYDIKYTNLSAEEIYDLLEKEQNEQNQEQDDSNEENGESDDANAESNSSEQGEDMEAGSETGEANPDNGNDSSQSDENGTRDEDANRQDEIDPDAPENQGLVSQPENVESQQELEAQVTQMIVEAAMQSEMAGQLPGAMQTIIENLKEPKQDWSEILQHFVAEVAANDYDWQVPDQQYIQRGLYIPSLHSYTIGNIVFVIDSSISINETILAKMLSELREASSLFSEDLTVIQCDTKVQYEEEVAEEDIESIEIVGRGGTRFQPVFDYVEDNDITPKALIYFTDGKCSDRLTEPDYPVIWAIYENPRFKQQFGEIIFVD